MTGVQTCALPISWTRNSLILIPAVVVAALLTLHSPTALAVGQMEEIKISTAIDFINPVLLDDGVSDNRLQVRGAEFMFYGPVDHLFDGLLNVAGHSESGKFSWEVHEAVLSSSKLIPRSRFRIGKFFLGIGRLNQFHQHDWPFVSTPSVQKNFFGAEGAGDTGYEYSILLPTSLYLDITFGVTNGYCFGHCHGENVNNRPQTPVHYIHPTTFIESHGGGMQLGVTYLGYKDRDGIGKEIKGFDLTYKKREGKTLVWLTQAEVFHRGTTGARAGETNSEGGAYLYNQLGFNPEVSAGLRLDGFSDFGKKFNTGDEQKNLEFAVVPTLAYKPSEFSQFRLEYVHSVETNQGEEDSIDRRYLLNYIFFIGAHPAHEF